MAAFADASSDLDPTLRNVLDQTTLKWIFVGGKGGVGKTTTSCSLAVQLAAVRDRVLIISTDPAHNLSDAFRQKFTRHPTAVQGFDNLFAMEVDPTPETSDLEAAEASLGEAGSFLADISTSIPGIDEAMSFAEVMRQVQSMDYSAIVFDTAPTGHTLRLLQFPTTLEKGLGKLAALRESFGGMISQVSRMFAAPGAEDVVETMMNKLDALKAVVEEVNSQFRDPDLTTFVCVCIPEFLSLYETERLVQELARFGIDARNIAINQVIFPDEVGRSRLLAARARMQQKYLDQFYDLYEDFHIVKMPLLEEEVRGVDALREFSRWLVEPYAGRGGDADGGDGGGGGDGAEALEAEAARLRRRLAEVEAALGAL